MEIDFYPVEITIRIDWSEMDVFGHVNNVMFMKYTQASRVNYWEKIGLDGNFTSKVVGPILASTACQFKKPLFYPGTIVVKAKVDFIKNTSFGISHQIYNEKNELCAEAQDVIVTYDFEKNEKINVPDWLRKKIEELQKQKF